MASTQQRTASARRRTSSNGSIAATAQRLPKPALVGAAAAAGLAAGTALGAILRGHRRPRVMGLPLPRGKEVKEGARQAVRAGRWLYEVQTDVNLLREQAQQSRRQSPIEVLLSGLTSRTLPRGR
jgi:hypothetical protein